MGSETVSFRLNIGTTGDELPFNRPALILHLQNALEAYCREQCPDGLVELEEVLEVNGKEEIVIWSMP